VVKVKPELEILIRDALDAPFCIQNCQQPGKMHCVKKFVDIWEVYKQMPMLRAGFVERLHATSLQMFMDMIR
jgi:hypothetical protein